MRRLLLLGYLVGAAGLVASCGGGGDGAAGDPASGCGEDVQERVDPDALVHILPGAPEPEYLSDPPTSGPHAPAAARGGVLDEPLSRSDQLGQLEAGVVLIQHGALDAADQAAVDDLAGDLVLVAPNDELPAPVVATAWLHKLTCASLEGDAVDDLAAFAVAHGGEGPGSDAAGG